MPGVTYAAVADNPTLAEDTPHVSWTGSGTEVDYYAEFAQWGPFEVERTVAAGVFLGGSAIANTGATITLSGSITVKTTEIKLITGP